MLFRRFVFGVLMRVAQNPEVQNQIRAVLEMYRAEAVSRQAKETLNQNKSENGENSLDNLINIS